MCYPIWSCYIGHSSHLNQIHVFFYYYKKHDFKKHEAEITGPVDSGNIEENKTTQ